METGTQIILQRMKDNPEEFGNVGEMGKWERIIRDAKDYLPQEDREALDVAYRQLRIDTYNERVLKTLAGESEDMIRYKADERYTTGFNRKLAEAVAKREGQSITATLPQHAAQHRKMVEEREVQIQQEMKARVAR